MAISGKSYELLEELRRFDIEIKTEAKIELQSSDEGPVYMVVVRDADDCWSFDYVDKSGKRVEAPHLEDEDMYRVREVLAFFLETFRDEDD